ncbi:aldose 1-epimerase family protein [Nocardioides sp. zg-536]|uniref:Aldose 1-epimerase family protein n=1 Tax=Nocardioides faecalis TaxID=2803858 RepID=A0A938Y1V5_9ACTN|nr:aldose 1-epimerase family protein [Nocardioides faecalis]MBM9460637.1 aldose 1-epimerase family protein [Nocardioides faecalis]QVI57445.1 aldose 1-epimerase family protein [Nocardioides faecalis]
MSAPTGEQYPISAHGYHAVVTQGGGVLRALRHDDRPLLDGTAEDAVPSGGRGQLLVPWPNRLRDGRYEFGGTTHQLALTEPSRNNASHGLVRWASWTLVRHEPALVELSYFLPAQSGYPWALDLRTTYALDTDGLTVTQSATNTTDTPAPYASGAHPYLVAGPGSCDEWELELPAATYLATDAERLLPTGRGAIGDLGLEADSPTGLAGHALNHAVTDLVRDAEGVATVRLRHPDGGGVALWVDAHHRWLQLYTGDDTPRPRVSLAVEPMTSPPDAFNSREDLVVLEPGASFAAQWGIRAL